MNENTQTRSPLATSPGHGTEEAPVSKRYGSISWNVEAVVADSEGDADTLPDVIGVEGTVTFTPRVPVVHYPNLTVYPEEVTAFVDDSTLGLNNESFVTLLASVDGRATPQLWTYDVVFELYTEEGRRVTIPAGKIAVFPDITMSLSVALTHVGERPTGSFTAAPFVWADPEPPAELENGTWWLNTVTGDLKEWRD